MSPLFSLKIVVPDTSIFAPAFKTILLFEKLIPPSTSMSYFKFYSILILFNSSIFLTTSGINF